ncbi:MAG: hypothetical protein R2706_19365 [Acidimicrobiales bacterium]
MVIPDEQLSISGGAIQPWSGNRTQYFARLVESVAAQNNIPVDVPWADLSPKQRKVFLHGAGNKKIDVNYTNRYGRVRTYSANFEGIIPYLRRRHSESESDSQREQIEGYMREVDCSACGGARLNPLSLASTVGGHSIADLSKMSIRDAAKTLAGLELSDRDMLIAERVVKEINARLSFLLDVGLDYLSLGRSASTLSGGEAQRIRLASQIGSGLVGVLYVLDEPSIGLHQRDNAKLIETLQRLRDLGNTVLVVEHDEETIGVADYVVDIGPGAGEHGGDIVFAGSVKQLLKSSESVTGQYLAGKRSIPVPAMCRPQRHEPDDSGRSRAQLAKPDRRHPTRTIRCGYGRLARVSRRSSIRSCSACSCSASMGRRRHRAYIRVSTVWNTSTRLSISTSRRLAEPHDPTRPRTPACLITFESSSPKPTSPRSAAICLAVSRSMLLAAAARRVRATARSRSRCTFCPTSTCRARSARGR